MGSKAKNNKKKISGAPDTFLNKYSSDNEFWARILYSQPLKIPDYWSEEYQGKNAKIFPGKMGETCFLNGKLPPDLYSIPFLEETLDKARTQISVINEDQILGLLHHLKNLIRSSFKLRLPESDPEKTTWVSDGILLYDAFSSDKEHWAERDKRLGAVQITFGLYALGKIAQFVVETKGKNDFPTMFFSSKTEMNPHWYADWSKRTTSNITNIGAAIMGLNEIESAAAEMIWGAPPVGYAKYIPLLQAQWALALIDRATTKHEERLLLKAHNAILENAQKQGLAEAGRKGGIQKNAAYAAQKIRVIELYQGGETQNKDRAALVIASQVNLAPGTVRRHLRNIKHPRQ